MKRVCRFCNQNFDTDDREFFETICASCTESVKDFMKHDKEFLREVFALIKSDEEIKYEFLESALSDSKILGRIAKAMFKLNAKDAGIGGPGTIAEFFCS